jgi:hypothetical protein
VGGVGAAAAASGIGTGATLGAGAGVEGEAAGAGGGACGGGRDVAAGWSGGGAAWAEATPSTAAQLANAPSQMQRAHINWNRFMELDSCNGASGQKAPVAPRWVHGAPPPEFPTIDVAMR